MSERGQQEVSVINVNNHGTRRRVTASQVRKRKKRKKKVRIYARLAVVLSIFTVILIVGISLVSMGISAISGMFTQSREANGTNTNIVGNNQQVTSQLNDDSNISNGNTQNGNDSKGEESTGGHILPDEMDEPLFVYGDKVYTDGELVVCIDPGHGGNDVGCVGVDNSYEKKDTLKLAEHIKFLLEQQGVKVIMTRSTDVWVDLADRPLFANEHNADVLVSIHRNNYEEDQSVKGFEAWINSTDSDNAEVLANLIMNGLKEAGISKNRGVKKGSQGSSSEDYAINIGSSMPSVLLEMGFMSSPKDNQLFRDNIKDYAQAIADAIIQWSQEQQY